MIIILLFNSEVIKIGIQELITFFYYLIYLITSVCLSQYNYSLIRVTDNSCSILLSTLSITIFLQRKNHVNIYITDCRVANFLAIFYYFIFSSRKKLFKCQRYQRKRFQRRYQSSEINLAMQKYLGLFLFFFFKGQLESEFYSLTADRSLTYVILYGISLLLLQLQGMLLLIQVQYFQYCNLKIIGRKQTRLYRQHDQSQKQNVIYVAFCKEAIFKWKKSKPKNEKIVKHQP
ncbi:hypothetical protein ABPG72_005596 [Tetrahymena utriculariae]